MGSVFQRSLLFGGTDEYVDAGDVTPLKFDVGDAFSLSVWFRTTASGSFQALIGKRATTASGEGYHLGLDSSGLPFFQIIDDLTVPQRARIAGATALNDGLWHHIVATKDTTELAAGMTIYVDGSDISASTTHDTFVSGGGSSFDSSITFQMGMVDASSNPLVGNLCQAGVYDTELTAAQVTAIYAGGDPPDLRSAGPTTNCVGYWPLGDGDVFPAMYDRNPVSVQTSSLPDESANSNAGTPTNMEAGDFEADSPGGTFCRYTALMDGSDEYVAVGDVAALQFAHTDAFSLSAWFKTGSAGNEAIASKRLNAGTFRGWALATDSGTLAWQLVNTTSTNLIQVTTTAATFADGAWHHVLVTYDGLQAADGAKIYVDGVLQAVTADNDTLNATVEGGGLFQIGALAGTANFNGNIGEVAVWNRELKSLDVRDVYNSGIPNDLKELWSGPELAGWWRMGNGGNDGTATNMEAADVVLDAPYGQPASEEVIAVGTLDNVTLPAGAPIPLYRMRGIDDGAGPPVKYVFWDVTATPDFDGSRAVTTFPSLVGSIVVGSIAVVARL